MQDAIYEKERKELYNVPTMLTINKTMKITGLSKVYLRQLIADDKIVYFKAGNRFLINIEKLVEYLNGEKNVSKRVEEDITQVVDLNDKRKMEFVM